MGWELMINRQPARRDLGGGGPTPCQAHPQRERPHLPREHWPAPRHSHLHGGSEESERCLTMSTAFALRACSGCKALVAEPTLKNLLPQNLA